MKKAKHLNLESPINQSINSNATFHQMEIAKRLNAIIAQLLPFLSQEVRASC